jgi:cytoskeletal protein RodZ
MRTEYHPARRSSAVGAFGEKLRKQREQRGIALDAISNTTKISTRMLRAIEEEHFDQLPGGVFNKGFVRAYARQVGLNEEEAVTDYLTALRESQIAAQTVPPNFRAQPGKPLNDLDLRNPELVRNNPPGHEVPKTDPVKTDLRIEDVSRNGSGRNAKPAESGRNKNTQPASRLSADRRRKDRRDDRRNADQGNEVRPNEDRRHENYHDQDHRNEDRRNRVRAIEGLQAGTALSNDQHPRPDYPEPVVSTPDDSAFQVPWVRLAGVLLLLTLTLAFWSFYRRSQNTRAAQIAAPTVVPAPQTTATSPLPSTTSASQPVQVPVQPAASPTPLTAGKALSTGPLVTAAAPNANTAPTLADALEPSSASFPKPSASKPAVPDADGNLPVAKSAAHPPAAKAPPTFSLLIRATETSSVSVIADGQPLLKETLIAPAQTSVRATREIVVHTGNAAGISFLLDGKEIPLSGAESEGESKTYTFDNTGLKSSDH